MEQVNEARQETFLDRLDREINEHERANENLDKRMKTLSQFISSGKIDEVVKDQKAREQLIDQITLQVNLWNTQNDLIKHLKIRKIYLTPTSNG